VVVTVEEVLEEAVEEDGNVEIQSSIKLKKDIK
jgi:hypothetical protein